MLTKNIWQSKGLYNGALGTVKALVYREGNRQPDSLPICILIEFDEYTGPSIVPDRKIVPIAPEAGVFDPRTGKTGTRVQFPLILGWAISIHKSQGLTLNRAILGIGDRESHHGITYVGCSRVKSYKGLAFDKSFAWERMEKINKSKALESVKAELRRCRELSNR
jgi:ATP-dependent DNA helicase PIF1